MERDFFAPGSTAASRAASGGPVTLWGLAVFTGTDTGAGTDADVSIELQGSAGMYGPYRLLANRGARWGSAGARQAG